MFLPKLARLKTNEIGHVNYQHPARNASHYGPFIDRFSSIAIYVGLRAIAEAPRLWDKYDDSENVLFRAGDFANPAGSALLRELSALPAISAEAERFCGVCRLPLDDVPDLETFISGRVDSPRVAVSQAAPPPTPKPGPPSARKPVPPPTPAAGPAASQVVQAPTPQAALRGPIALLDGANTETLTRHVGQRVEVIGYASHLHPAKNFALLDLGADRGQSFSLVLRSSALQAFHHSGFDPQTLVGKWVKVSGVMTRYKGRPQIEVDAPAQIQLLGGEVAARQMLGSGAVATAARPPQVANADSAESILDKLYGGRTSSPSPAGTIPPRAPARSPARPAPAHAPARSPAKPAPAHAPARSPAKPAPAHTSARSPAKPRPAHDPRADRAGNKAPALLVGIFAAAVLGVISWAIWGVWEFVKTVH